MRCLETVKVQYEMRNINLGILPQRPPETMGTLLEVGEEQSESWGTVQPLLEVAVQTEN